jgi:hypothetical protein
MQNHFIAARARAMVLLLIALSLSRIAVAQEPVAAADVAAARELGLAGLRLADSGSCQEAIDKLARSELMHHAPTVLGRLGECQVQVGKIVEGTENLNRVAREVLAPNAPAAFVAAQERAKLALTDAKPKIARLKIAVLAPPGAEFAVTLDSAPIPIANLNMDRPVDPGSHLVSVTGAGYKPSSARVSLAPGSADSVALTLERDPASASKEPAARSTANAATATSEKEPGTSGGANVPAIVALSIGGAGLVAGAVFGVSASSKNSDLDKSCPEQVCPTSKQSTLDSAKAMGWGSTVGFGIGIVSTAIGVVLLLTHHQGPERAAQKRLTRPSLGLGGAGLTGAF